MNNMKITVLGTGHVGLSTAVCFAQFGHQVVGVGTNQEKTAKLQKGVLPFYEPGFDQLVKQYLHKGNLTFTTDYRQAIPGAKVVFVCVGTPARENGQIDLSFIETACRSLAKAMTDPLLVVVKSTVPPGIQEIIRPIIAKNSRFPFDLATCPEFLREGRAAYDTFNPDRIILGVESQKAARVLLDLHQPINAPKYVMDINSAQMVKYSANAFLATRISFINQIANLCDRVGADVESVAKGLGADQRIGPHFLHPGLGYGGSCFPKDIAALTFFAKDHGLNLPIIKAASLVNQHQVLIVFDKIEKLVRPLKGKTIAILGLSFKAGTDDLREAPSIPLINKLFEQGVKIKAYDPVAMSAAQKIFGQKITFSKSSYQAAKNASALVLVTEWPEFAKLDFKRLKRLMKKPNLIDSRNFFDPEKLKKIGFTYLGVGRR